MGNADFGHEIMLAPSIAEIPQNFGIRILALYRKHYLPPIPLNYENRPLIRDLDEFDGYVEGYMDMSLKHSTPEWRKHQPRREIATAMAKCMAQQLSTTLSEQAGTSNPYEFIQPMIAGLTQSDERVIPNTSIISDIARMKILDKKAIVSHIATKYGDYIRGLCASSPEDGLLAHNIENHARTIAALQLLLEGNESVRKAFTDREIKIGSTNQAVIDELPDYLSESVRSKTREVLSNTLWMINTVAAIYEYNPSLAEKVFTKLETDSDLDATLRHALREKYGIGPGEFGFFRDSITDDREKWEPLMRAVWEIFGRPGPINIIPRDVRIDFLNKTQTAPLN